MQLVRVKESEEAIRDCMWGIDQRSKYVKDNGSEVSSCGEGTYTKWEKTRIHSVMLG